MEQDPDLGLLSDFVFGEESPLDLAEVREELLEVCLLSLFRKVSHTHCALVICTHTQYKQQEWQTIQLNSMIYM